MTKFRTQVVFDVEIELDEAKFDEAFLSEFRENFYGFWDVDDHIEHLAQLEARGLLEDFTEGYGPIRDMGIKGTTLGWEANGVERV